MSDLPPVTFGRRSPRDFPLAGLALLTFGALTETAAIALCVFGVTIADAGLGVLGATISVWVAALWFLVLSGVRDDWPPPKIDYARAAREAARRAT